MDHRPEGEREPSDEQVLADFLAGSEAAFALLVRRYSRDLFQFVARFVRNTAAAEDVVQETFVQVHQSAEGFDASRRFRPWLFTIAANKARDHLRGKARKKEVSLAPGASATGDDGQMTYLDMLPDTSQSPSASLETDEERQIVRGIVDKMPAHLREVLELGYYQRFPYKEIADILGIPLGTVKSRLHAAVSHFANAWQRETERRHEAQQRNRRSDSRKNG